MSYLFAVGITVGLLAGVWVYLSGMMGLIGFVGFSGWASYSTAGGRLKGVRPAFYTNMSGVLWRFVTIVVCNLLPGVPGILFTILFAAVMCWQAKFAVLGFIPGTFIGNAAFYASGNDWKGTAVALVCGISLGILSDVLARKMSEKKETVQISRMDHQHKELGQAENMVGGGGMGDKGLSSLGTDTDSKDPFTKRVILDALPCDVIIIDMNGRTVDVNSQYCHYYDRSAQSLMGMDVNTVEANIAGLIVMLDNTTETKIMFREMGDLILQSNIMDGGRIIGGIWFRFHNVKENSEDLEMSYSRLNEDISKLSETNWDVIYASDGSRITLPISSAAKSIRGVDAESLIGKSVYELEKQGTYYPSVTWMVLGSKQRVQAIQTTATRKRLLVLGTPIKDESGKIVRVINTSRLAVNENELYKELEETRLLVEEYKREPVHTRIQEQQDAPFIANNAQMLNASSLAMKIDEIDIMMIITGESGVGKEALANYIHSMSNRKDGPYIRINCGVIPPTLIESGILGYERSTFTGAKRNGKLDIFELANHGTLFLDEVSEISLTLQVKFLRVLQENRFMRVGGTKQIPVDVRIIAVTNKDLLEKVNNGTFRKDLYYRLSVVVVNIPPLREREDDILPLSLFFLDKYNKKYNMDRVISPEVMDAFMTYKWDGNIREPQNTVEGMVVLSPHNMIGKESLPEAITNSRRRTVVYADGIIPLREAHQMVEDILIQMVRERYSTTTQMAEAFDVD